jgi:hypothetical protein
LSSALPSGLVGCNLKGTLPASVSAFVDIMSFVVYNNAGIGGIFPSSAKAWTKLSYFNIVNTQFAGGPLPALNYAQMSFCRIFFSDSCNGNVFSSSFSCPMPPGVTDNCRSLCDGGRQSFPITTSNCQNTCNSASTNLPQAQCDAWVNFYDATNGDKWIPKGGAAACTRTDPCSCKPSDGGSTFPVCNAADTTVEKM